MAVRPFGQEDSIELRIARDYLNRYPSDNGSFLHLIFMAFCKADRMNFNLLKPVIRTLIDRYEITANLVGGV